MVMVTQGITPILVQSFEELKTDIKRNPQDLSTEQKQDTASASKDKVKSNFENSLENKGVNFNDLASKLQDMLDSDNVALEFSLDDTTKKMILKIVDKETKEVVRQYPPEIALKIARIVSEIGQFANAKV
jgi:flagellar protein FlaG